MRSHGLVSLQESLSSLADEVRSEVVVLSEIRQFRLQLVITHTLLALL